MFDIGWSEILLVAVVALLVIGPKDLPKVLRQMGRMTRAARRLMGELRGGVDDLLREAELDELRDQVKNRIGSAVDDWNADPTGPRSAEKPPPREPLAESRSADEGPARPPSSDASPPEKKGPRP